MHGQYSLVSFRQQSRQKTINLEGGVTLKIFQKTDIGKKRDENQDRVWSSELSEDAAVVVLCDGMGGENAGSYASQLTVDFMAQRIMKGFRPEISRNSLRNLLITGINGANSIVYSKSVQDITKAGMGTTCVAGIILDDRAYIVNVGDSRAYHIYGDNIQQITKDHTYMRKLIEDGHITERESLSHPERNTITRAVGAEEFVTPDYFEIDLYDDSILLFSSDGLHSYGDDITIAEMIVNNPINKAPDLLINYALEQGGKDNITVCVVSL